MPGRHRIRDVHAERVLTPTVLAVFVFGILVGMLVAVLIVKLQTNAWPWQIPPLTING